MERPQGRYVLTVTVDGDRISAAYIVANPAKLAAFDPSTTDPSTTDLSTTDLAARHLP